MMENVIEIVNPIGVPRKQESKLAQRRYENLVGRRVGLLDNNKPNADKFLQFIGEFLQARHPEIELVAKRKMTRMESDGL
ncbi:MAG: UGSC family (seleno)protein, partial [Candidatus Binatia bacterium]